MSIIRRHKTENYSVISNHCHRNQSLSAKAKGIFAYIMTLPDDWKLYQTELATHFSDGKDSIRAGIQELIKAGYMTQTRVQDESGKMAGWEYDVMEYPPADLPIAENPLSVNPPLLSTEERPKTKKNTLSGASIESPVEDSPLPPPQEAATPPPKKDEAFEERRNKAKELETHLIAVIGRAKGRKLLSKPSGDGVMRLLVQGIPADSVKGAINWLSEYAQDQYCPVVESGKALFEKWDKVQAAMSRCKGGEHKERAVLKGGKLFFVDRPKVNGNWCQTEATEQNKPLYRIMTPEEYKETKQ